MKTWIKICGTTSVGDAIAGIESGADALGFIFAPSKRRITVEKAREVISQLPSQVERIGVFLDQSVDEIVRHVMELDLTGVQLHGEESPLELGSYLSPDRRTSLRIIKTFIVQESFEIRLEAAIKTTAGMVDAWLLDSGAGSGKTFDWQAARKQMGDLQGRFIIAGGLTPENVGEALRVFHPWGVDVVSGVESEPGRKDLKKLPAFVQAVREAENQKWGL